MNRSWLSIMGVYQNDEAIFDDMQVPNELEKDKIIQTILYDLAELEIIFPDPKYLKLAIGAWSYGNRYKWQGLYDSMHFDYNPIWNVDADIKDVEGIDTTGKRTLSGSDKRDITTDGTAQDKETINTTETKSVQGFNNNDWVNSEKLTDTGTDTHDYKNHSHTDDDLSRSETENTTGATDRNYTQRRTGNIGVTTTQAMIQQEREIRDFNLIKIIVEDFKKEFCIMVY